MGHALGLGHSQYTDATMFGTIHSDGRCASIRSDDARSIAYVYPLRDAGPKPLAITTTRAEPAIESVQYLQVFEAQGGVLPYRWEWPLGGPRLPSGLGLDPSGVLFGSALTNGTFTFPIRVIDATGDAIQRNYTLTIVPRSSEYDGQFVGQTVPGSLQSGQQFTAVLRWLNNGTRAWNPAAGFKVEYLFPPNNETWGVDQVVPANIVQPGFQLEIRFTATAPANPGAYDFQWRLVQDGVGVFGQLSKSASVFVYPSLPPSIDGPSSLLATVGAPFSFQFVPIGGSAPFSWSVTAGSLPSGLALNPVTGVLAGTASSTGTASVTIRVTDASGRFAEKQLTISVTPAQLAVVNASLPAGSLGVDYSAQLTASGGRPPYAWALVQSNLPSGLSLNFVNGLISGTPSAAGVFPFAIRVIDADSRTSTKSLSISVSAAPLRIADAVAPQAVRGTPFSLQMVASGGTPPYSWSLASGSLPTGLGVDPTTGLVNGTPSISGSFPAVIAVRDQSGQQATISLLFAVIEPSNAPSIVSVKYKTGKRKLIVVADRLDPQAVLLVDGQIVSANFGLDRLIAKHVDLVSGIHEIRVVNPGNVSSTSFTLRVP
jgi:hypothetical protein